MWRLVAIASLLFGLAGCGVYTFNPSGKSSVESIAIDRFENKTAEYELADQMTDLIIDALISDGTLNVVSAEYADAVLVGTLTRYQRVPSQYDDADNVIQYAVEMDFEIALRDPGKDADIWRETMAQKGLYDAATQTEEAGRTEAINLLIENIINRTTKSW